MFSLHNRVQLTSIVGLGLSALVVMSTAACGEDRVTYTPAHHDSMLSDETTDESATTFSHADIMFAEMMIPHHEQAVEMSDLALLNSTNPQVRALATRIKAAQAPEITLMQSWVTSSGMGDMHAMMDDAPMAGMLDASAISKLRAARGAHFDRLFLGGMIAHHEGAVVMARRVSDSANSAVAKLASSIIASQTAEIAEMKALLATLG